MALQKKPPVVTIMGHVDHGKTSLLDYIRKSRLAMAEYGEITQATGAYQIELKDQKITFIDTPGHEAFIKMRQRGAMAADLVVLVVAANDGVQPQTKESIKIIHEAKIPYIVAINKIDLPDASVDKIKAQLAESEVLVEGYGGNVVVVPVSAKTGQGIDQLLEMILLTAEMNEIKADSQAPLEAVVIESKLDKLCGCIASLIVKNGQINKNTSVFVGNVCSKIKMLKNDCGQEVDRALPGDPVLVLGFTKLPPVGSIVTTCAVEPKTDTASANSKISIEKEENRPKLKIILKADVYGSLEAILGCLSDSVEIMDKSTGEINQSDVMMAKNLKADIYGFNLKISSGIEKLAQAEKVKIKTFRIIYDLLGDIEKRIQKLLSPEIDRKFLGRAEILQVFDMKGQKIAGARVIEGKINKGFPVCIKRGETVLADAKIISLKEQKQDINEVTAGGEFGAVFGQKIDFQPGDVILSYRLEEY